MYVFFQINATRTTNGPYDKLTVKGTRFATSYLHEEHCFCVLLVIKERWTNIYI